jgi:general secretion pathway protein G
MDQYHFHRLFACCLKQPKRCRFGFTFIEVMVAIAIVGTLAAIAIPNYISYKKKAEGDVAVRDIKRIEEAITVYVAENGELPDSLDDMGLGDFKDPWGNPYEYLRIEGGNVKGKGKLRKNRSLVPVNTDYDLYSKGKDGKSQTPFTAKASQDDIVRANDGGFIGLVSDY